MPDTLLDTGDTDKNTAPARTELTDKFGDRLQIRGYSLA